MAVISTDILLRTALEAGIADMRRNPYLLDDCFGGLRNDIVSKKEYGEKEVEKAKQFILTNNIPVMMPYRVDLPMLPCIIINQISASEAQGRSSLADDGEDVPYNPTKAGRPVHRIVPEFTPDSYDAVTGHFVFPADIEAYQVAPGMFVVAANGNRYEVRGLIDDQTIQLDKGINEDFRNCFVQPEENNWLAHREQLFFSEQWAIVGICSEVGHANWMRQFISYILARYREAYLEGRGFAISSFQAGVVGPSSIQGAYESRFTLNGDVELSWIKYVAPKFNRVEAGIKLLEIPKTPEPYTTQAKRQGWSSVNDNFAEQATDTADFRTFGSATDNKLLGENHIDLLGEGDDE